MPRAPAKPRAKRDDACDHMIYSALLDRPSFGFDLPLPPSANRLFSIVRGITKAGKPYSKRIISKVYAAWREVAGWELKTQYMGRPVIQGRYELQIIVSPDIKIDIDNAVKAISDILVTMNIISDDRHAEKVSVERSKFWTGPTRCKVYIRAWAALAYNGIATKESE